MNSREGSSVEQSQQPALCVKCNTFFSNAACNDLCSKCHREHPPSHPATMATSHSVEALASRPSRELSTSSTCAPTTTSEPTCSPSSENGATPEKSKSNRCTQCRTKVGLCGFKCKCGQLFCGQHRYAESHACGFDYKATERAKLIKANPVVQAAKVMKL